MESHSKMDRRQDGEKGDRRVEADSEYCGGVIICFY